MTMDCDECWIAEEVAAAKAFIMEHGITHSYCAQVLYASTPGVRYLDNSFCFVPFFSLLNDGSILGKANPHVPCLVDPTRKISHFDEARYMVHHLARMHHMYAIRNDIAQKMKHSSYRDGRFRDKDFCLPDFDRPDNRVVVQDRFGIAKLLAGHNDS